MHIKIDAWEIIEIVFSFYVFKWLFRIVFMVFILKIIEGVKRKGEERINGIRQSFKKNIKPNKDEK